MRSFLKRLRNVSQRFATPSRSSPLFAQLAALDVRRSGVLNGEDGDAVRFLRYSADELLACLMDRELPSPDEKVEAILLALSARAISTLYAVVDSLEIALSREAMMIHRSLFETMLQAWWLRQDPEPRAERYIRYDHLYRWYQMKYLGRWADVGDGALDAEIEKNLVTTGKHFGVIVDDWTPEAPDDVEHVANDLKRSVFKGPGPGTWFGKPVYQLVEDIGDDFHAGDRFEGGADYLEYLYRMVYGAASAEIHPSPRAVGQAIQGDATTAMKIEIGPNPAWTRPVCSTAFPFAMWALEPLDSFAELGLEERMHPVLVRLAEVVASPTNQERGDPA